MEQTFIIQGTKEKLTVAVCQHPQSLALRRCASMNPIVCRIEINFNTSIANRAELAVW